MQWTAHLQAAPTPAPVVDPYAQINPYGLPPVAQRPYVSAQSSALPAVPMQQIHQAHNSAAIGSVVVGALAFCLSIVGFIPGSPVFYLSLIHI